MKLAGKEEPAVSGGLDGMTLQAERVAVSLDPFDLDEVASKLQT